MMKAIICFLLFFLVLPGCNAINEKAQSNSTDVSATQQSSSKVQQKNPAYIPSAIEPDFPVPKQAEKTNHRSKNPKIRYVRYAFSGLMDLSKRDQYFREIEKWGWRENKQEQMGAMHVFVKGEKRIQITIHPEFFTIFTKKD